MINRRDKERVFGVEVFGFDGRRLELYGGVCRVTGTEVATPGERSRGAGGR